MTMNRKINVPVKFIKEMIRSLFNTEAKKQNHIIEGLMSMLSDYQLEMFIELINTQDYIPIKQYSYVKFKPNKYYLDDYNKDVIEDLGLYKDGYLFAYVYDHDSYHSDFNSYSHKMKVKVYLISDGEMCEVKDTMNTLDLTPVDKLEIPYFQLQEVLKTDNYAKAI